MSVPVVRMHPAAKGIKAYQVTSEIVISMAGTVPSQFKVVKTFPLYGLWQQYRLDSVTQFSCDRCQKLKKSKLIAGKEGKWDSLS